MVFRGSDIEEKSIQRSFNANSPNTWSSGSRLGEKSQNNVVPNASTSEYSGKSNMAKRRRERLFLTMSAVNHRQSPKLSLNQYNNDIRTGFSDAFKFESGIDGSA
jgi:hypothetical protein